MLTRNERLTTERNVWFAAVRPDGRPHLTPIWFVWVDEKVWLCTQDGTVKARNVNANPCVSFALQDGDAPVTAEGTAAVIPAGEAPKAVMHAFTKKYNWDIASDPDGYGVVIAISITKWLFPGATVVT